KSIRCKAGTNSIVHDDSVFVQHHAITNPTGLQRRDGLHVHSVEEIGCVRAEHFDLSQGGGLEESCASAYGERFAFGCLLHALAAHRVASRTLPVAILVEHGTARFVPGMTR